MVTATLARYFIEFSLGAQAFFWILPGGPRATPYLKYCKAFFPHSGAQMTVLYQMCDRLPDFPEDKGSKGILIAFECP